MTTTTQRFGIRRQDGARSSEWVIMWKPRTGDVYIATRTLGGTMKASLHMTGRCHVRTPSHATWHGSGNPPPFLDEWQIDPQSTFSFPFSIVIPSKELRTAPWPIHRDKGTIWIAAPPDKAIEVGFFLVRRTGELTQSLHAAGWSVTIVDALLPDGRRLIVAGGSAEFSKEKEKELCTLRLSAKAFLGRVSNPPANPRLLLLAGPNEYGVRKFVEAALLDEDSQVTPA